MNSLTTASTCTAISPKIPLRRCSAPRTSVAVELIAMAEKLGAVTYIDAPVGTTFAQALQVVARKAPSTSIPAPPRPLCYPHVKVTGYVSLEKRSSSNRWRKLPDGTIIQMGISASGPLGSPVNITLPISFSNTNYCVVASYDNARSGVSTMVSFAALPVSPSQFSLMSSVTEQGVNPFAYWIAFGD